ncbi:MAG: hypothetical protein CFE21_15885 [Bacteroidetes bacterium B1(2017)]|nr:MAG: hypothetical protein CFE21_15885 [Bacteroidetes bacterium B1(2017)]
MNQLRGVLLLLCLSNAFYGISQATKTVDYTLGVQPLHAWLMIHSPKLDTFSGTTGTGFQVELNRYRKDDLAYSYAHRNYNSGFALQYMHFSNAALGNALNLSYFIEPFLIERGKFSIRMRAAGGINFASNPYDKQANPLNDGYSSHVNGYLGFGFSSNYRFSKNMAAFAQATFSHFSNGNTKNPNLGLNFPNIGAGVEYKLATKTKPLGTLLFYKERWRFDLGSFVCNKSLPFYPKERYWAYGIFGQAGYRSGAINAWTFATEAYADNSMRAILDSNLAYKDKQLDHRVIGLMAGHEFVFNRCIFSQQLGVYIYKEVPQELINKVYHRWGFNYKLNRNFMMGINLNANLQKAFILDARLVYSFYR